MTSLEKVYSAFLSLVEDDEWTTWVKWEREEDWFQLLQGAIVWFKFPRVSLEITEDKTSFKEEVSNQEIQVLAQYMKLMWLSRVIDSVDNLRPLYQERDFSPAKMLSEFEKKQANQLKLAEKLEARYYRTNGQGKPYDYSLLGGR